MIVQRKIYPPAGRLVSVADNDGDRLVEIGDMTDVVRGMPMLPVMAVAPTEWVNRRRFISVATARQWARSLDTAEHKKHATDLRALLDWVATVPLGGEGNEARSA